MSKNSKYDALLKELHELSDLIHAYWAVRDAKTNSELLSAAKNLAKLAKVPPPLVSEFTKKIMSEFGVLLKNKKNSKSSKRSK